MLIEEKKSKLCNQKEGGKHQVRSSARANYCLHLVHGVLVSCMYE